MNNLKTEMARYGVSNIDVQRITGLSERTVRDKLNGSTTLSLPEALKIRDSFFPGLRLEYLFATPTDDDCAS